MMPDETMFADLFDPPAEAGTAGDASPDVASAGRAAAGDVIFDIETGPVDSATLESLFEFDASKVTGSDLIGREFDPAAVKLGNLKDQAKIKEKIEAKRKEHEKAAAEATAAVTRAREEAWLAFVERAPLSPLTGQVLAIGFDFGPGPEHDPPLIDSRSTAPRQAEDDLIKRFWARFLHCLPGARMIGHNILGFDLPFLVRRSWLLGVEVPPEVFHLSGGRWQWHRAFVDTMVAWSCGVYGERLKLDRLAQYFGTTRKTGDGAEFHRLFHGTPEERETAFAYLENDLLVTREVVQKMGVATIHHGPNGPNVLSKAAC